MLHWLRRGIDGWRLDAAYAVPAQFWAAVLPAVREEFPDAWFVGEMIHGNYIDYVEMSGLDSVTQYELWWAIWSSIDKINFHELQWTLGRHAKFVEHFVPLTFLGNHDVTRVASQISDPRHWSHAVALLGFLPGVPCVYYGDEFGLEAVKENRPSGDDAVRPEMPKERWSVHPLTPGSGAGISADDRPAPPQRMAGRRGDRDPTGGRRQHRRPGPGPARRAVLGPGPQPDR